MVSLGYGPLDAQIQEGLARVEKALQAETAIGDTRLDRATTHLAAAGGKRLRPLLVLIAAQLGATPLSQEVIDSAVAVELTHLASLYHDDVMDDAPMRRGVPSAHVAFGNTVAILSGDVLFARASRIVAGLGPRAVALHATTFERLCTGELHETQGRLEEESPRDFYLSVLADKTGSLIAAAARYGVISSGESEELAEEAARYGEKVGVAFQIADDYIDIMSSSEATGKTPGTDLREGVDTMPIIFLREDASAGVIDEAGARILTLLDAGVEEDEALAQVVDLLRAHPVMDRTLALAKSWVDEAMAELVHVPDGPVRRAFERFGARAVSRIK